MIVTVTDLHPSGDGLASWQGEALRVPGTIPGERVEAESGARGIARVLAVLDPSPHRVVPRCRHFGPCGGCTWQHISYPHQLRLKQHLLQELLDAALGRSAPRVAPTVGTVAETADGMPWGYRHKVHFVFGPGTAGRSLVMGHFGRGTRAIVPIVECPVHAEPGNRLAFAIRDRLVAARVPGTDPATVRGLARHLVVRVGRRSGECVATLVVTRDGSKALKTVSRQIIEREAPDGWNLNVHGGPSPFLFGTTTRHLHGRARLREEIAGVSFLISPTAFFQTNVAAAESLVRLVLERVERDRHGRVLDLYAGAGLFSLPIARTGRRVTAIEENLAAVEDGRASQRFSRIAEDACRFVPQRVEAALEDLAHQRGGLARFDLAVLDPPRQGCTPEVLRALGGSGIRHLVYVSCDPVTLARDLRGLATAGYRIAGAHPIDMFPHTAHLETVSTLERAGAEPTGG